jgi:hypothetical protein
MELIPQNIDDIRRYYYETYVKLTQFGDKLFHIDDITGQCIKLHDQDHEEYTLSLHMEAPYNLNMMLPHKSMYQMGDYAYCMQRRPAQQYHRGISGKNCQIQALTDDGWARVGVDFGSLCGYTDKQAFLALDTIPETATSAALSPRFAVNRRNRKLYCDNRVVGSVSADWNSISVFPILTREFNLLIERTCRNRKLKVERL